VVLQGFQQGGEQKSSLACRVQMQDLAATRVQLKTVEYLIACKPISAMQAIAQPGTKPRITVGVLVGIFTPYALGTTQPSLDRPVIRNAWQKSWIQRKRLISLANFYMLCCRVL
jgi:hypothetical protein